MKVFRGIAFLLMIAVALLLELGCGNQYRPVANPINGPGGQPQATHYAFVVNNNPNGDGSVSKIDVSGDTVLQLQTLGVGSIYGAFVQTGSQIYIANEGDDTVSEFPLLVLSTPVTINLLPGSRPVAVGSTIVSEMYVLNSGPNSACPPIPPRPGTGSISTIGTTSLAVQFTICVGVNPIAMVQQPNNGKIYIFNQGDNSISVFNPSNQTVSATLAPANGATIKSLAISLDGSYVFVVTQGASGPGTLDIIATVNDTVAGTQPLGVAPTFSYVDPHLNRLYVTNTGDNTVSVFDTSNVNLANNPPVPLLKQTPVGVAPAGVVALQDGSRFYVSNSGDNTVSAVSASSFVTQAVIPVQQTPTWVAADPTSSKVYVTNLGSFSTSIIQTSNNTVVQNLPAPPQVPGCTVSCALQQPVMVITQ